MAFAGSGGEARDYWRELTRRIHDEEQQLKELQLDYHERSQAVEGLKFELRQLKHETQTLTTKEARLVQSTAASIRKQDELKVLSGLVQQDRELLAAQFAAEQQGHKDAVAKLEAARTAYAQHLAEQQAHVAALRQHAGAVAGEGQQQMALAMEEQLAERDSQGPQWAATDEAGLQGTQGGEVLGLHQLQ